MCVCESERMNEREHYNLSYKEYTPKKTHRKKLKNKIQYQK